MNEEIKLLLGIKDNLQDGLIELIVQDSTERILSYINKDGASELSEVPAELDYIIRDVSIKRFNKLNSEGAAADSEEGRSFNWEPSYLYGYEDILNQYTRKKGGKGIARWF